MVPTWIERRSQRFIVGALLLILGAAVVGASITLHMSGAVVAFLTLVLATVLGTAKLATP